ncbi:MAG: hypothetical protein ACAI38_25925 [Myxococcota bacterium]
MGWLSAGAGSAAGVTGALSAVSTVADDVVAGVSAGGTSLVS